ERDGDRGALRSQALDDPWFGPERPPVVLGVGRLVRQKRFELLIDAFHRVRERADARLMILGEGPERDRLTQRVAALGLPDHVRMPGFERNPLRHMARAEVVVSTSRYEGLPAVLIQALACDAKVVATDCPGGSADVLGHGAHGRLVRSDDVDDVARAVLTALEEPRRPNDPASWEPYTVDNAVNMYRRLITDVATHSRRVTHRTAP
ncbi:MAG: glycosyltransferase, partial [Actinobacteria bacterium]|nr:glycosyltransferase [Actinomycetota bacterium]